MSLHELGARKPPRLGGSGCAWGWGSGTRHTDLTLTPFFDVMLESATT